MVLHNSVHMTKVTWNFTLQSIPKKHRIKMQQNIYTPKSPN